MSWDVREQTEYGTLRAYIAGGWQHNPGSNGQGEYAAPGTYYAPRAFIQFAGFTLGKATSFYDFYVTPAYSNTTNVLGRPTPAAAARSSGATPPSSAAACRRACRLEDPKLHPRLPDIVGTRLRQQDRRLPDLVANVHLDASWGMAQIMGALHQVTAQAPPDRLYRGRPSGRQAWLGRRRRRHGQAADASGKGDTVSFEADYSQGAINYTGSGWGNYSWCHGGFRPTPERAALALRPTLPGSVRVTVPSS